MKKLFIISPQLSCDFYHIHIAFRGHIVRDRISGPECKSPVASALAEDIGDIFAQLLFSVIAYHINIDAAEVSDFVTIPSHPFRERGDLVLVRMLGVNTCRQKIRHDIEDLSAGMEQKRLVIGMYQIDNRLIFRNDMRPCIIGESSVVLLYPRSSPKRNTQ